MSLLFSPYQLGRLTLPNRIVIAPMCQYSAEDGNASDWHVLHFGRMALSGAGLFIIEAAAVEPVGRISPRDIGLWSDANEAALGRALQAARAYARMPIGIQLAHAGRKASTAVPWEGGRALTPPQGGWQVVAPSPLPFDAQDAAPQALDEAGIERVVAAFAQAARRSERLGLDLIELHAAHGYLLHEFLSPLSNQRSDAYGGALENRMRLLLRVFDAVRAQVAPDFPVGVRISATDWVEGGWDVAQSIELARQLHARGSAYVHVSSAGLSPQQQIPLGPGYQVPLAQQVRAATGAPTIAVGLITEAQQAETILASGQADLIGVARAMLYDPHWPWRAAVALGAQVQAPPQYWRALPHGVKNLFAQ